MKKCSASNCVIPKLKPKSWDEEPEFSDSIEAMVADYREVYLKDTDDWIQTLSTFTDFICGAANKLEAPEVPENVKFCKNSHQYIMPHLTVKRAYNSLTNANLDKLNNFANIYDRVIEVTKGIDEFGILAQYDFTQRYCYNRGIMPDGVYLHAGVKTGVKELGKIYQNLKIVRNKPRGKMIELSSLPQPIAELGSFHAENFLCVYKKVIAKYVASKLESNNNQ